MQLRPTQQSLSRGRQGGFGADLSRPRRWLTGVAGVTARPGGGGRCLVRDAFGTGSRVPGGDLGASPSTGPGPNRGLLLSIVFIAF